MMSFDRRAIRTNWLPALPGNYEVFSKIMLTHWKYPERYAIMGVSIPKWRTMLMIELPTHYYGLTAIR